MPGAPEVRICTVQRSGLRHRCAISIVVVDVVVHRAVAIIVDVVVWHAVAIVIVNIALPNQVGAQVTLLRGVGGGSRGLLLSWGLVREVIESI